MLRKNQAIFRRDGGGNLLRPHRVALLPKPYDADGVDRERGIEPAGKASAVACVDVVATREYGEAGAGRDRRSNGAIREGAATVTRDDDITRANPDIVWIAGDECDAIAEARPFADERVMKARG